MLLEPPSLAQSHYSSVATFGGQTVGTFTPDHYLSVGLGAKELQPEHSEHFSIGAVYQPTTNSSFIVEYFYTYVKDRIMLSNPQDVIDQHIDKVSFFTNAVDTETYGVDIKYNQQIFLSHSSSFTVNQS